MRLIDADELKSKLQARHDNGTEEFDKGYNVGLGTALDLIDNAPTVEKPRGKWLVDICENVDFMTRRGWRCSVCNTRQTYGKTDYCPYCGAIMSKEGDK